MAKGLALLLAAKPKGKPGMGEDEESPMSGPAPSAEDDYGSELADMLGVKDSAAFTAALKGFVRECVAKEESGGYDEEV